LSEKSIISPRVQAVQTITAAAANEVMPSAEAVKTDLCNETLQRLPVQRKLAIGAADDPLEHEADAMADTVMRMSQSPFVQRKCANCEEEEKVQRRPLAASITPFIQTKGANGGTASDSITNQISPM
jgi:hypothetical protein